MNGLTFPRLVLLLAAIESSQVPVCDVAPSCPAPSSSTHCGLVGDSCIYYIPTAMDKAAAAEACEADGAHLIQIHSREMLHSFYGLISTIWGEPPICWSGLYQTDKTDEPKGNFAWHNYPESPLVEIVGVTPWGSVEPNNVGGIEDCTEFHGPDGLNDLPCNERKPVVCQYNSVCDAAPFCPVPRSAIHCGMVGDSCVYYMPTPMVKASAAEACEANGAHLIHIDSWEKLNSFNDVFTKWGESSRCWSGLHQTDKTDEPSGNFEWHNYPKPPFLETAGMTPWGAGEPNDAVGNEDCTEFVGAGGINDISCHVVNPVVCEYKSGNEQNEHTEMDRTDPCYCNPNQEIVLKYIGESVTISSPRYPEDYCKSLKCGWTVIGPSHSFIKIIYNNFDTQDVHDEVTMYDTDSSSNTWCPFASCHCSGDQCPETVSRGSEFYIEFITDNDIQESGFEAVITTITNECPMPCPLYPEKQITLNSIGERHIISSPISNPNGYCSNMDCYWRIIGPENSIIQIKWNNTQEGWDRVSLSDGLHPSLTTNEPPREEECSGTGCSSAITKSRGMIINFRTDNAVQYSPIDAVVTAVEDVCPTPCSSNEVIVLNSLGESRIISSPGYPAIYCRHMKCGWTVSGPEHSWIQILWNDIDVEEGIDYMIVYDGPTSDSDWLMGCPKNIEDCKNGVSTSSEIFIEFNTDGSTQQRGFELMVTAIRPGTRNCSTPCSNNESIILDSSGVIHTIKSPGYPVIYCNNLKCGWTVIGPENSFILLTWENIDTEQYKDEVVVFDGPAPSFEQLSKCSGTACDRVHSSSSSIFIEFFTNESEQRKGFEVRATPMIRGGEMNDNSDQTEEETCFNPCNSGEEIVLNHRESHMITSPGFPQGYCNNLACSWRLIAPMNSIIKVEWNHFHTEDVLDKVIIYGGGIANASKLLECSGMSCENVMSRNSQVFIEFITDTMNQRPGFEANVTAVSATDLLDDGTERKGSAKIRAFFWSICVPVFQYVFMKL